MINKKLIILVSITLLLIATIAFTLAYEEKGKDSSEENDKANPQETFLNYLEQRVDNLPANEKRDFEKRISNNPKKAFLEIIDKLKS